ncbi:MAG: polysaccharide biosynthesis tyrosine autokinase [Candidatus Binatia bacterium]
MHTFWALLVNRWRLILVIFFLIVGLGGGWIMSQIPLYTASTTLLIGRSVPGDGGAKDNMESSALYRQKVSFLRSPTLAATVIINAGLESNATFAEADRHQSESMRFVSEMIHRFLAPLPYASYILGVPSNSYEDDVTDSGAPLAVSPNVVSRYLHSLSVIPIPDGTIKVQFTTPDPKLSQELADAHVVTFIRTTMRTQFTLNDEMRAFLEKEHAQVNERLTAATTALQKFRQEYSDELVTATASFLANRLLDISQRLTDARIRRIDAEALAPLTEKKEIRTLAGSISNDQIDRLNTQISRLEKDRLRLVKIFPRSHPRLKEFDSQIAEAYQHLDDEIAFLMTHIRSEYTAAFNTEKILQEEIQRQQQTAVDLQDLKARFTLLSAEVESLRIIEEHIRSWLSKPVIEKSLPASNISITEPATLPLIPSSPLTSRNLLLTIACGAIGAIGFAYLFERLDMRIHTPKDVWQATAYPSVGAVPPMTTLGREIVQRGRRLRRALLGSSDLFDSDPGSAALLPSELILTNPTGAEWYALLCSSLFPPNQKKLPRSVLFTEVQAKDGATVLTLNVGITLAQSGRKVVVVDTNLGKGRCHELLGRPQTPGLGEVLRDGAALPPPRRRTKKKSLADDSTEGEQHEELSQTANTNARRKRPSRKLTALVESVIQETSIAGLSIVTCGASTAGSPTLLTADVMKEMLDILRRRFDFVLLDSSPVTERIETIALSQMSEATFLVIRGRRTKRDVAQSVAEQFHSSQAPVLGVILTGVDPNTVEESAGYF